MLELRPYQRDSIDSVYQFWRGKGGNPLIELATGTGKSAVAGTFCKELLGGWPDMRIGVIAHVKELIGQNAQEMLRIWPSAPIGIYSAGLGKRDARAQILFGGIQSIYKRAEMLGGFDVLLIDECHLIPRDSDTMYGQFIAECRELVPDMRIVGLTATPYRLGSGRLDEGEGRIFDKITYTYDIGLGVADGYLCPLTSRRAQGDIDLTGIKVVAGDFVGGELERRMMRDQKIAEACAEVFGYMREQGRKKAIVFCTGVNHAYAVRDELARLGLRVGAVTGRPEDKDQRDKLIAQFRNGWLDALTGVGVLTTGFNVPDVDLIALMRPTLSTGLYVQMLGRGTRPIYEPGFNMDSVSGRRASIAASSKPNCLILDYAGCGRIHGPVDELTPQSSPMAGKRDQQPAKADTVRGKYCPKCGELLLVTAIECADCGYLYPVEAKHEARADTQAAVMKSEQVPEWRDVDEVHFARHEKNGGGTPSFRVDYLCGPRVFSDWLCFEHQSGARDMAHKKWDDLRADTPPPATVNEALDRVEEIARPTQILVAKHDNFWRVLSRRFAPVDTTAPQWSKELEDEIPF